MNKVNIVYFAIGFTIAALLSPIVVNCSDKPGQLIVELDAGVSGHGQNIASHFAAEVEARKIDVTQFGVRDDGSNVLISFDLNAGNNYLDIFETVLSSIKSSGLEDNLVSLKLVR